MIKNKIKRIGKYGIDLRHLNKLEMEKINLAIFKIQTSIVNDHEIIFCTCISAGRGVFYNIKFDIVIIDECTQAIEPSTIISIMKLKDNGRLILLGDHKQLPPLCKVS